MKEICVHISIYSSAAPTSSIEERIHDSDYEPMLLGYVIDNGACTVIDLTKDCAIPEEFCKAIISANIKKYCMDLNFTTKVLERILNMAVGEGLWYELKTLAEYCGMGYRRFRAEYYGGEEEIELMELEQFFQYCNYAQEKKSRNTASDFPAKWNSYKKLFSKHLTVMERMKNELIQVEGWQNAWEWQNILKKVKTQKIRVDANKFLEIKIINENSIKRQISEICNKNALETLSIEERGNIVSQKLTPKEIVEIIQKLSQFDSFEKGCEVFSLKKDIELFKRYRNLSRLRYHNSLGDIQIKHDAMELLLKLGIIQSYENEIFRILPLNVSDAEILAWLTRFTLENVDFLEEETKNDIQSILYKGILHCFLCKSQVKIGAIEFLPENENIHIKLPSGRVLYYWFDGIEIHLMGKTSLYYIKKFEDRKVYYGKKEIIRLLLAEIKKDIIFHIVALLQAERKIAYIGADYILLQCDIMSDINQVIKYINSNPPIWGEDIARNLIRAKEEVYD